MKVCKVCRLAKNEFYAKKSNRDGYDMICASCYRAKYEESRVTEEDAKLETEQVYIIPYQTNQSYAYLLARRIAREEMTLSTLRYDLKVVNQTTPLYRNVLTYLYAWKQPKSSNSQTYV